jgi:hypothetical protein
MRKNNPFWVTLGILIFLFFSSIQIDAQTIFQGVPEQIDSSQKFLFYLHGKIIEDQGINAVSEKFGAYEYEDILKALANEGFVVISEARPKDTDPWDYAKKNVSKIQELLNKKVPPKNITVVGASKGAGITVLISHLLKNGDLNFVIMAICNEQMLKFWEKYDIILWGNVLSIYDEKDNLVGSCSKYFDFCKGKGLRNYKEIELKIGTGHGILYKPLKEWIQPIVEWSKMN